MGSRRQWVGTLLYFLIMGVSADAKYLLLVTHWPARDGEITIRTNELLTHAHDVLVFLEVISFSLQSCPPGLPWLVAFCF